MCKTIEQYYNQNFDIDTTKIHNINISTRIPCVLLQPYLPPSCPHHLFITWQSVICSVSIILSFKGCYINPLYICMCVCVYVCVCVCIYVNICTIYTFITDFFSLSAIFWPFTQIVMCINCAFLFIAELASHGIDV